MRKEPYERTELDVITFVTEDVILTSGEEYEGWNPNDPDNPADEYEGWNPNDGGGEYEGWNAP